MTNLIKRILVISFAAVSVLSGVVTHASAATETGCVDWSRSGGCNVYSTCELLGSAFSGYDYECRYYDAKSGVLQKVIRMPVN